MNPLIVYLWLILFVDAIITYYFFREAFIVRSNMRHKYFFRFMTMASLMVGAYFLSFYNPFWACLLAGAPAILAGLFIIAMAIALFFHKGPWN
jgi:hypothetical protein